MGVNQSTTSITSSRNEGFSEPLGIVGAPSELNLESRRDSLENPRSSIDVTKLRLVKSTDDGARESGVSGTYGAERSSEPYSLNKVVSRSIETENTSLTLSDENPITPLRIENAHGNVTLPLESPPEGGDLNRQRCKQFNRQGKWARFSGTDEDLARTALDHAKFQAAKRRPLLKQISHSMSRRNGFNSQDEFDTADEQWVWSPNNSYDNLQLQAVNCSICGNYISVSNPDFPLPDHIQCNCNDGYDSYTENDDFEEKKEYEN